MYVDDQTDLYVARGEFDTKQSENSELGYNKLPCNFSSFSLMGESLE
jgi:hypothetical protein